MFEYLSKSWAFYISEKDLTNDLCFKNLGIKLDKLIESGYFKEP